MSLKDFLLISCAVIATTATVQSQVNAPIDGLALTPATPARSFALGQAAPVAATTDVNTTPLPAKIDLSALRYFAAQNDLGRVAAEIRLIRAKHPDWKPPEDLFAPVGSGVDEQPLWDLFGKHDLVGLRVKMESMKHDKPDWTPSSDLTGKVALAEAHDALVKASDANQWPDVIAIAAGNRMLLACSDVDALWRTAEALAKTGDEAQAVAAYRYVLSTCTSPSERLATVQKASVVLPSDAALDTLLQMGKVQPDGRTEFASVRLDRFRRKIGDAAAGNDASAQPTDAEIAAVTASATAPNGLADAKLLGWYHYAQKAYPEAQTWFRSVLNGGPDAKAAEGLVLALRDANEGDEARKVAIAYAGLDPVNRKLMVDIIATSLTDPTAKPMTAEDMKTFVVAVDEFKSQDGAEALRWYADNKNDAPGAKLWARKTVDWKGEEIDGLKSAAGAEALGWQFYQASEFATADQWFQKSGEWSPSESAAIGLVMTARRLHHDRDYAARIAQYKATYPRIVEMEAAMRSHPAPIKQAKMAVRSQRKGENSDQWDRSADSIIQAFKNGQFGDAVSLLDQRRAKHSEPRGLTVVRAWALYQKGDWDGAKQVFSSLDGGRYSDERAEGLRVLDFNYSNPRNR